ncbi:MAG: ABC transporter ATP-binding protein [Candidatus Rokubacteria bacterium]|nr:ABC transporter ATP-binding protein [Candidatus Rokubacteria bacterium]
MRQSFRSYLATLVGVMRWKVALALGLMLGLGLTEGIGVLMLVPLLQLVGLDVQQGGVSAIARFVSSIFAAAGVGPTLVAVLGAYALIVNLYGLLARWQTTVSLGVEHGFVASLRTRLYRAIANTSWPFFSRSRSADFTHVLTAEVERVGGATHCLLHSVASAVVVLVYVGFAMRLSLMMTAVICASGVALMVGLRGRTRVAHVAGEGLSEATNHLYAAVTEHLGGMKIAKSYGAEERHAELFARLSARVRDMYLRAVRNQADVRYWFEVGSVGLLSAILYVALELLALSAAELLLFLFLFGRLMPKFASVQQSYQSFVNLLPAFASIVEMQRRCEAAVEPRSRRAESVELNSAIRLDRVSFAYDGLPVIRELELSIPAGRTTAIVGPSGSGKSTIADLIIGLVTPDDGRVLVDGVPLTPERVGAWRDRIGYVTQETFLFHDTVRANLLWAAPGATDDEVREALSLAAAEEFVARLPKGLDTMVGDRGVLLSGGERQRLALARALLRKPCLLILDEAVSALDSENERRIRQAMGNLRGRLTLVVISHRLSAVREADIIYVIEDGRLAESGTWGILIARERGRFRALWQAQGAEREHGEDCGPQRSRVPGAGQVRR